MEHPTYIYLDLDRTLLDTDACMAVVFSQCERLYGLSQDGLRAEVPHYYHYVGHLRYYDFFGQMAARNLDPYQVEHDLLATIDQDFLFPDAHEMLRYLTTQDYKMSVLSFGKHNFQQFKYRLLPQLSHLPFISVLYPKDRFILEAQDVPSLLIDDVAAPDLPNYCTQFIIDRQASEEIIQEDAQHIRIRSLQTVENILAE